MHKGRLLTCCSGIEGTIGAYSRIGIAEREDQPVIISAGVPFSISTVDDEPSFLEVSQEWIPLEPVDVFERFAILASAQEFLDGAQRYLECAVTQRGTSFE